MCKETMQEIRPITPEEVDGARVVDPVMIQAVNKLIAREWNGKEAVVFQDEIIAHYLKSADRKRKERADVFSHRELDFEDKFRAVGWCVEYDKPDYNETRQGAFFRFSKKE
jgi:hypothetical protein